MKLAIFTVKGTSLRENISFEPICVNFGWGDLVSRGEPEKSSESQSRLP